MKTPKIKQKVKLRLFNHGCMGHVVYSVSLVFKIKTSTFPDTIRCSTTKHFEDKDKFMKFAKESLVYLQDLDNAIVEYDYRFNSQKEQIYFKSTELYMDDFELLDPDSIDPYED